MLESPIFQVIVGMIFVFSLLSVLVTQINSVIASMFKLRASHLRKGINELVQDPVMRAKILSHPLIGLLKDKLILPDQQISNEEAEKATQGPVNSIEWIAPESFVNVMTSIIRVGSDQQLFNAMYSVIDAMPSGEHRRRLRLIVNRIVTLGSGLEELRQYIAAIEEDVYREALQEALDDIDDEIGRMGIEGNTILSLKAGVRSIKNPYFRSVMETILATSESLAEAEAQIARWFDEGMSRATEMYARTMARLSLIIGILIAIVLNVDTLQLARTLWEDPALRAGLVAAAQEASVDELEGMIEVAQARTQEGLPATPSPDGAAAESTDTPAPDAETDTPEDVDAIGDIIEGAEEAQETITTILELRLPIGWRYIPLDTVNMPASVERLALSDSGNLWNLIPGNSPHWLSMILSKIVGLVATMIAIAQGAPFWFNLLRRLTGQSNN